MRKKPANVERTRANAVSVAATDGRKCRDVLAESPNKGNAKTQTTPHVQILKLPREQLTIAAWLP